MIALSSCLPSQSHFVYGETLLQLSLLVENGKHRGKRLPVRENPLLIGRGKDCDLRLGGGSVSRRHCLIRQQPDQVDIMDLGSRNGTVVNDVRLDRGQEATLWHHDRLQIGDWQLRVSIRDSVTGEPLRRSSDDSMQILDELDELGAALGAGQATWMQLASTDPAMPVDESDGQSQKASPTQTTQQIDSDEAMANRKTVERVAESEGKKADRTGKTAGVVPDSARRETAGSSDSDVEADPTRIPAHLRPKGPADSQDAANEALRRIFRR